MFNVVTDCQFVGSIKMSFNFGAQKTASSFALPVNQPTISSSQFGGAGDDAKTKAFTFSSPASTGIPIASTQSTALPSTGLGAPQLGLKTGTSSAPSLTFAVPITSALNTSSAIATTAVVKPTATDSALSFGNTLFTSTLSSTISTTTATKTTTAASSSPATLTYAQLEDSINKWTIDLEEQGKHFCNQAKQINAWDRLLITNGEKILNLNNGIERVKQQQQQLDQELDFILAQQKELEDLVAPLEKELSDVPVTDLDRNHTYQMAENLDWQLKQMSEDLKEIIEHLNEANKNQELSNPIVQIGRILNAHMNSLQWIDRKTSKITTHLDQISKMHDMNKRNHEINLQKTYD